MDKTDPIKFAFAILFLLLILFIVSNMTFLLPAERSYIYIAVSAVFGGLLIYAIQS